MTYFFVSPKQIKKQKVTITGPDAAHITRVLRLRPGDGLIVADGQGKGYRVRLDRIGAEVEGAIEEEFIINAEPAARITLVQGIPKGEKMEMIIQKCTELGVKEIIPWTANRAVVRLSGEKLQQRVLRWRRVAYEAAKQCQRGEVPGVSVPMSLKEVFAAMPPDALGIMPWEEEGAISLRQVLKISKEGSREKIPDKIFLFIGPEGGLAREEVELAKSRRVAAVSLGRRILRTETAAIAAVAMILYELGDLGG